MGNIIDYAENELSVFEIKDFNVVDSLILSQFSYLKFERMVPGLYDACPPVLIKDVLKAEFFESMFHYVLDTENNRRLLYALAASPRFRNVKINYYVNKVDFKQEKQFSAVTFQLKDDLTYVAYRGTDAHFIGWKEDFNMSFMSPVPSQEEGKEYLNLVASIIPGTLIVGGHSKGGNIAVYSAMNCSPEVKDRIVGIYSHDGPGFKNAIFQTPEFQSIKDRINKTIPQSSLIGMLLLDQENYSIVESKGLGISQHNPFLWMVDKDDFSYTDKLATGASYINRTLNQWLSSMSDEKRELFTETLYKIVSSTQALTINEFTEDWKRNALAMLSALKNIDPETRKMIIRTINELVKLSLKNLRPGKEQVLHPGKAQILHSGRVQKKKT